MAKYFRQWLQNVRWPEITLGKLALGLIAVSAGVVMRQIEIATAMKLLLFYASVGVFAAVWNDWCDRIQDRLAAKANAFERVSRMAGMALIIAAITTAFLMSFMLARNGLVFALTCAQVVAAFLYSAPRTRLKEKGWLGLAFIIAGQYVLPACILLACALHVKLIDGLFLGTAAFVDGLTLEVGHQLSDRDNDIVAGVRTAAVVGDPTRLSTLFRCSAVLLGALLVACPIYLSARFFAMNDGWLFSALMWPCILATVLLAARTWPEIRQAGPDWNPYYGTSGESTRILFSYFPNCLLPLWMALAATLRDYNAWPLPAIALGLLWALAVANASLATGPRHYGFKWHCRQVVAMFAGE